MYLNYFDTRHVPRLFRMAGDNVQEHHREISLSCTPLFVAIVLFKFVFSKIVISGSILLA